MIFAPSETYNGSNEKAPAQSVEPQGRKDARVPKAYEHAQRPQNVDPSSTKRSPAAYSGLVVPFLSGPNQPKKSPLRSSRIFASIYRKGQWIRGGDISVGVLINGTEAARIGIRTRRGLKGAIHRNRLRRQVRAIVYANGFCLRGGIDLIIVIHPATSPLSSSSLKEQLQLLCRRASVLR